MALDPQIAFVLDEMRGAPKPASIEEARAGYDRTSLRWVGEAEEVAACAEAHVGAVCVRLYRPEGARGTLVWLHGGGWIMGNLTSYDPLCRALANRTGATVASVDYRLAPEHPFPGPVEDCEAALRWVAEELPGAAPIAIGGDSAGGNLAAVVTRRARDAGGPPLCCQLLVYPATDAACATASMQRFGADAADFGLGREEMQTCWAAYAPGASARSPDASPLRAADLSGLPPAVLVLAECDPLLDEATDYADRLREAGVPADVRVWPGTVHGFLRWRAAVDLAHTALDDAAAKVRRALDGAA